MNWSWSSLTQNIVSHLNQILLICLSVGGVDLEGFRLASNLFTENSRDAFDLYKTQLQIRKHNSK